MMNTVGTSKEKVLDLFGVEVLVGDRVLKRVRQHNGGPAKNTWHIVIEIGYCLKKQVAFIRTRKIHGFIRPAGGSVRVEDEPFVRISRRTATHWKWLGTLHVDHTWRKNHVKT